MRIKLVDITFHANTEYSHAQDLVKAQHTSLLYLDYCQEQADITVIKHYSGNNTRLHDYGPFRFFRGRNRFGYFSLQTWRYLRKRQPDLVLVRGLIFPWQVLLLRLCLGNSVKILVRHHADTPFTGIKKIIQQWADAYIDAYLFTSAGIAEPWIKNRIIRHPGKIVELPATLTTFLKRDKMESRRWLSIPAGPVYLWVGRLHPNKDPLNVLKAFDRFLKFHPEASLHLVYQSTELLKEVKEQIGASEQLSNAVFLHGSKPYESLPYWFSAANYFISASHAEAGSSAILEAMACGCIPIVSRIPASMQVTGNGSVGLHFAPGNVGELFEKLIYSSYLDTESLSLAVEKYFTENFSAAVVTQKLMQVCRLLAGK